MQRRTFQLLAFHSGLAMASSRVWGQAWPSRPIKMVVAHPPGSGVDVIARALSDSMATGLGQPVIVENKTGGQNTIAAQAAAKSAPDGYTIYFATAAALVSNQYLFKSLSYDPRKDFEPIGFVGASPFGIFVAANAPFATAQDLIKQAKANPGKVSVASQGPKSFAGITARLFGARAGIELNQVAYVSVGVALQDLMGGHIDVLFSDIASAAQLTRQGKLRMLAVTSEQRVAGWDAPPLAEVLPAFDMEGWFAMVAPRGVPADIVARLNRELDATLAKKDVRDKIHNIGPETSGAGTPQQLAMRLSNEHRAWADLSKTIGLLPE